jgi:hypothetical protein
VEKLLRSTGVSKIYLLIRTKKGVGTQQRLSSLLNTKIFDRIRDESKEVVIPSAISSLALSRRCRRWRPSQGTSLRTAWA